MQIQVFALKLISNIGLVRVLYEKQTDFISAQFNSLIKKRHDFISTDNSVVVCMIL